jgi:hypothetical protein
MTFLSLSKMKKNIEERIREIKEGLETKEK